MADVVVEMGPYREAWGDLCPACAYRLAGRSGFCGPCVEERDERVAEVVDLATMAARRAQAKLRKQRQRERRRQLATVIVPA